MKSGLMTKDFKTVRGIQNNQQSKNQWNKPSKLFLRWLCKYYIYASNAFQTHIIFTLYKSDSQSNWGKYKLLLLLHFCSGLILHKKNETIWRKQMYSTADLSASLQSWLHAEWFTSRECDYSSSMINVHFTSNWKNSILYLFGSTD